MEANEEEITLPSFGGELDEEEKKALKVTLVKTAIWIALSACFCVLIFSIWTVAQDAGGPAIGVLLFATLALCALGFVAVYIWWLKIVNLVY